MPVPTTAPLGATTSQRKWKLDVDVSATAVPNWVRVMGMTDFTPNPGTVASEDDADYDGAGYGSASAVGLDWGASGTFRRAPGRATPTQYDPGQEFLRLKGRKTGTANTAHVRFYEYDPVTGSPMVEAYEGYAMVVYANSGGGPRALSTATLTLTGQGELLDITHPASAGAAQPVISGFDVASVPAAGGVQVVMLGSALDGATAMTVGGVAVPAANFEPISFSRLAFIAPAKAAGAQAVTVTTPGGTSAPVNLTYV